MLLMITIMDLMDVYIFINLTFFHLIDVPS